MSSKPFAGKVGAARGIARGTALYLAERGASLSLSDILETELQELSLEIKSKFPEVDVLAEVVNVADAAEVDGWMQNTITRFGYLHGAVNFAGVLHNSTQHFVDIKDEDWNRVISVNLTGTCTR